SLRQTRAWQNHTKLLTTDPPGKMLRRTIQAICEGRDPGDLTTIDDPASLNQIRQAMEE
ncbi:hypothetical protein EC991793_0507, partial [Escherichia coli 99.1793]